MHSILVVFPIRTQKSEKKSLKKKNHTKQVVRIKYILNFGGVCEPPGRRWIVAVFVVVVLRQPNECRIYNILDSESKRVVLPISRDEIK